MLLNVISLTKLFATTYSVTSIKKFKMTADPSQLFRPQKGCYVTIYFESTCTTINIKKETVANSWAGSQE